MSSLSPVWRFLTKMILSTLCWGPREPKSIPIFLEVTLPSYSALSRHTWATIINDNTVNVVLKGINFQSSYIHKLRIEMLKKVCFYFPIFYFNYLFIYSFICSLSVSYFWTLIIHIKLRSSHYIDKSQIISSYRGKWGAHLTGLLWWNTNLFVRGLGPVLPAIQKTI